MSAVPEDPRLAAEAIVEHHDDQGPAPSVQEQHAPGPQNAPTLTVVPTGGAVERPLTRDEVLRPAIGALSTTLGCAFLVGGMFVGLTPRIYAAIGGIVGVVMAVWAARATRRASLIQALSLGGVMLIGLVLLAITGFEHVTNLGNTISKAAADARLHRPPAPFDPGWKAILPWTVGMVGYAAAWVGSVGRKPALGVLVPIPIIAFAAIAQPSTAQVPAGIVAFVTFAVGLTIIYRADRGEGEGVSTAYELKRAARAAPLVGLLIAALALLAQTNLLFPAPLYDPTQRAQLPKSIPLKGVPDRVLFTSQSPANFPGPWRTGVLDVYDGVNWRFPPYAASSLKDAPRSGLIDEAFGQPQQPQVRARIIIEGLQGTVLPLPGRTHGLIVDNSPPLVTDKRSESVRVKEGQVSQGLAYDVQFALLPTEEDLRLVNAEPNKDIKEIYLDVANRPAPESVRKLLLEADTKAKNRWDRLNLLRQAYIDTVTVSGPGLPSEIPPTKVEDMFTGTKEASPFEFVAAQVLLARWAGIPARVAYGFDGGKKEGSIIEYRPRHGATWLEVYFQGRGWIPVTGLPKRAKSSLGQSDQVNEAQILPSDEIAVQLFIPLRVPPKNVLFKQAQILLLLASPFILVGLLIWLLWPIVYKARRRGRRRQWALQHGRTARIAIAYAELRDMATDLGVGDPYHTPLAYVHKVIPDEEHRELAWLVTRCLWGDLRATVSDDEVFAAEELSRSLRRRMFEAQPFTIRGISLVSRISLRNPYAPELLSPPLKRIELRKVFKLRVPKPHLPFRKKVTLDEAIEEAV